MFKRILAIVFIFGCTTVAWFILGGAVTIRTQQQDASLRDAVGELWGGRQVQCAPVVEQLVPYEETVQKMVDGQLTTKTAQDAGLGLALPEKLNPGPWVSRVTFFAPVSLFLFFFLLFLLSLMRGVRLHPMHYFFLGAAFFSFHLLLAYLVDHISVHAAVAVCSVVSIGLVVSYMRLVTGARFALVEVGLAQLVYLVGFAYTFFLDGATGLTVTVLCIATLFGVMQLTGRLDWERVFERADAEPRAPAPS